MADEDYILDISSMGGQAKRGTSAGESGGKDGEAKGRAFISIQFECCNVYQRIYRNAAGTAYVGWCPKCSRKVEAAIGPGGVNTRFFRAR